MQITDFSLQVQQLFQEVQQQAQKKIILESNGRHEDWLAFDQSGHKVDASGNIHLQIAHSSVPDFTLAHELRHIEWELKDYARIKFPLTTAQPELDRQLKITASSLIGSVEHLFIMQKQRNQGEVTAAIEKEFEKGIYQNLAWQDVNLDNYFIYYTLVLLDILTLSQGQDLDHWQQHYIKAYSAASKLYQKIAENKQPTTFSVRRQQIRLLELFTQLLVNNSYPFLPLNDFVLIEPVVSPRQLRLTLGQVFQIKHSKLKDLKTNERALILVELTDQQNSAILRFNHELSSEQYRKIYQLNVQEFLQMQQINYYLR